MRQIQLLRALRAPLFVACVVASPALAAAGPQDAPADPTLSRLIEQTLAVLPELKGSEHLADAQAARSAQAGAWPDPVVQLGIQNDGFKSIEVGTMETSFISIMASQTIPWPGKTRLRESISELAAKDAGAGVRRMMLSAEAFVRSSYLDLMWARERHALFERRRALWQRALEAALARYEAGTGAQVDVLRAKLELTRLEQQHALLEVEELSSVQALNRARQHPGDEPIVPAQTVRELSSHLARTDAFSAERAVAASPELAAAKAQLERTGKQLELAQKSSAPDLTLGAGFMYRGSLPPMWLLTVAAPLPVFGASRQAAAVRESRALGHAAGEQAQALEQLVRLRSIERKNLFTALARTVALYERELLDQSGTTADAMLTQYRVGKGAFASVLEANAGLVADQEDYLRTLVAAERLLIAEREVSLQAVTAPAVAGGSSAMSGAMNGTAAGPAVVANPAASVSAPPASSGSAASMSGM